MDQNMSAASKEMPYEANLSAERSTLLQENQQGHDQIVEPFATTDSSGSGEEIGRAPESNAQDEALLGDRLFSAVESDFIQFPGEESDLSDDDVHISDYPDFCASWKDRPEEKITPEVLRRCAANKRRAHAGFPTKLTGKRAPRPGPDATYKDHKAWLGKTALYEREHDLAIGPPSNKTEWSGYMRSAPYADLGPRNKACQDYLTYGKEPYPTKRLHESDDEDEDESEEGPAPKEGALPKKPKRVDSLFEGSKLMKEIANTAEFADAPGAAPADRTRNRGTRRGIVKP